MLEAMLADAVRVCEASFGTLYRYDGNKFHPAVMLNTPPTLVDFQRQRGPFLPLRGTALDRLLQTEAVVRVVDDAVEQIPSPANKLGGARSLIAVPMFSENKLIGAIFVYRQEVRPFSDTQMGLLKTFAAQAVIAIEKHAPLQAEQGSKRDL